MYLTFAGLSTDQLLAAGGCAPRSCSTTTRPSTAPSRAPATPLYGVAAVQVILAAIEKSDGTRKGVTDAVFSGEGITIPADKSVIGKEIKIDPTTGDTVGQGHLGPAAEGRQGNVRPGTAGRLTG